MILSDIISASARLAPQAPAIDLGDETWTYAALDAAASRIASVLVAEGVGPGDRVAVCLGKSPETVAALFGILRAGAVFVPLDKSAPIKRLSSLIADCRPAALFGSGSKLRALMAAEPREGSLQAVIDVTAELPAASGYDGHLLRWKDVMDAPPIEQGVFRKPGDLAYILYTSGSTGVPKGVMITHDNALAFTSWARRRFGLKTEDRVASVAPFHFDLSTFDLYSTLEAGATVVLVPEEVTLFPAALAEYLEARHVTVAYLVPSLITGMLLRGNLGARRLEALRTILFAGEVFQPRYLAMLMQAIPGAALFNLYGPTETNVCTFYEVRSEDAARAHPVPIGEPASGDSVFALDESGRLVAAPGCQGELFVCGPTVAAGYWNDEAKTRALFLETHPQAPPGTRVYRTGDRVSLDPSGMWLYHGRGDHMVKSRGYRVELGDIEAALYAHPSVDEAAAVAIPDDEVGSRIKAFIVLKDAGAADGMAIKRHCAERLPRYMVPEFVEFIDAMPRTSTGKVDRTRLAAGGFIPRSG